MVLCVYCTKWKQSIWLYIFYSGVLTTRGYNPKPSSIWKQLYIEFWLVWLFPSRLWYIVSTSIEWWSVLKLWNCAEVVQADYLNRSKYTYNFYIDYCVYWWSHFSAAWTAVRRAWKAIQTLTSVMAMQCSTSWAIRPTGHYVQVDYKPVHLEIDDEFFRPFLLLLKQHYKMQWSYSFIPLCTSNTNPCIIITYIYLYIKWMIWLGN